MSGLEWRHDCLPRWEIKIVALKSSSINSQWFLWSIGNYELMPYLLWEEKILVVWIHSHDCFTQCQIYWYHLPGNSSLYLLFFSSFPSTIDPLSPFCQAGSNRGDAYLGKLGQLENFLSLLISRIELQQMERMRCGVETDADDGTCCICYTCEADAEFAPCSHRSCYGCITRHLLNCHRCFFCNATVLGVIKSGEKRAQVL